AAGEGARLDPGVALPLAPLRDEVDLERVEAAGERPRLAVGPQPHVDAEREALGGRLREQADERAPGALVARLLVHRALEEEHEVDVGGDVQLAAAEL